MYFKDLELHTIELKKFTDDSNEELSDIIAKVKNTLAMWVAFLTRHDLLKADNLPQVLNDASLKKAITVLVVMNFSPEERDAYENHLKWLRIEANTIKKAESRAKAEGKLEGLEEGMEKGIEQSIKQGVITRNQEIARNLLAEGMEIKSIIKITGLSEEEIRKL